MNKQKHIIICSTSFHEYDRRLIRISGTLQDDDYTITWISRTQGGNAANADINHVELKTIFKNGILFYLEFNLRLWRLLRKLPKGLINSIDLDTLLGCWWARKKHSSNLVFDAHEIFYEVPELTGRPIKKYIWKRLASTILPHIKYAYTVNNSLKDHHEKKYNTKFEVIRNVPNTTINEVSPRTNKKTLVYLGVLNKGRGIEILITLMKKLKDYKLLLIGEGDLSDELRALAEGSEQIIFYGYTEPSEISAILDKASIGINILEGDSLNYKFSLANKFFDYLHAGLPSINMAYPEYESILKKHPFGVMINDYTEEAVYQGILSLENDKLYKQLAENCIKFRSEYTWEHEANKLTTFYKKAFS